MTERAPRELLEFAIEQANDGIAIMEFTGDTEVPIRIVYANQTIERLSGYTRDELLDPTNPFLRVQTQNRATYDTLLAKVLEGMPARFEIELGGKDRSTWCEIRWSPLRVAGGQVTHYVAVLRDITERRRAQAEREMLYRAIEEASDYVALFDTSKPSQGGPFITYANGAFRKALGYEPREIVGMSYTQFLAPDNNPQLVEHIAEMFEVPELIEKEIRLLRRDQSIFWAEISAHPIRTEGGNEHWFVVARDISSLKQRIRDQAIVTRAIDALPLAVEIYGVKGLHAVPVFRNQAAEDTAPLATGEHIQRALTSLGIERTADGASVVPLSDDAGVIDAIVAFVDPSGPGVG